MNLLPTGICYFNSDGTVKLANTQIYQLFRILAHKDLQEFSELRDALHTSIQNGVIRLAGKKTLIFSQMERYGIIGKMKSETEMVRFI